MKRSGLCQAFPFFDKLAVRVMTTDGRHEVETLADVMFGVSFDANGLRRHVKSVEDCDCVATERSHDELSSEDFQKEKLRRAGECLDASPVF